MDMHDMSFDDGRFDAVYASHSLEHSYDVGAVVRELGRVGRPGAVVGVEVPLGKPASRADRIAFESLDDLRAAVAPATPGSPMFDQQWQLIGLHRMQGSDLPRIGRAGGTFDGSEGVSIQPLLAQMATVTDGSP